MPFEFQPWEEELQPQTSSSRRGVPPRKSAGVGILEPPGPPAHAPGFLASSAASFLLRALAWIILAAVVAGTLLLLFSPR
jgi:hypothetical protein